MAVPVNPPCIRIMLCLKKKDEVTDEFFHDYWKGNHVKLALENAKFVDKVLRYNQFHTSPKMRAQAEEFKIPVPEYDGIAEVWVKDLETWMSIVTDEDFVRVIAPDENHFIK
ncbi:EthD domain-containing protein, partial [Clohesyomyces aquaticus]